MQRQTDINDRMMSPLVMKILFVGESVGGDGVCDMSLIRRVII
jgi:hypothetical protein